MFFALNIISLQHCAWLYVDTCVRIENRNFKVPIDLAVFFVISLILAECVVQKGIHSNREKLA